jgi:[ribosomal protein S18]-alanine N-acetyltransferase
MTALAQDLSDMPDAAPLGGWPHRPASGLASEALGRRVCFAPMLQEDLDSVCEVEKSAYAHPWTHKHFADSLASGYPAILLLGEASERELVWPPRPDGRVLLGYVVAMPGVDEVHLLNITVSPKHQRQGWARCLLDGLVLWSRGQRAEWLWLEVRAGNVPARGLYDSYGFQAVGLRKRYYPAGQFGREDAVVMSFGLVPKAEVAQGNEHA